MVVGILTDIFDVHLMVYCPSERLLMKTQLRFIFAGKTSVEIWADTLLRDGNRRGICFSPLLFQSRDDRRAFLDYEQVHRGRRIIMRDALMRRIL